MNSNLYMLGPMGTYGHQAAVSARTTAVDDFLILDQTFVDRQPDVFTRLLDGGDPHSKGVVAIENSIHGLVGETFGTWLRMVRSPISVVGEIFLPIRHRLLTRPDTSLEAVTKVVSHEVALSQCSDWLTNYATERAPSTAHAARAVSESNEPLAAIASEFAAETYGLAVRFKGDIANVPNNMTRFHVLALNGKTKPTGNDRTALVFKVQNKPSALLRVLFDIANFGVNVSAIHSVPLGAMGDYLFYCEIDCHIEDNTGLVLYSRIMQVTERLHVLGSYPQAQIPT